VFFRLRFAEAQYAMVYNNNILLKAGSSPLELSETYSARKQKWERRDLVA